MEAIFPAKLDITKSTTKSLHIFPLFLFCLENKREIFFQHNIFCQTADEGLHVVAVAAAVIITECLPGTVLSTFPQQLSKLGEGGPQLLLPPRLLSQPPYVIPLPQSTYSGDQSGQPAKIILHSVRRGSE